MQFLADTEWRLFRIAPLEAAIWARGRRTFADHFADEADASVRDGLIKLEILDAYRKDFNNLALQERRLRNHSALPPPPGAESTPMPVKHRATEIVR